MLGNLTGLEQLRLNGKSLTGRIPSKLGQLVNLTHLYIEGNRLRGCIPTAPWDAMHHDIAALGLSTCPEPTDISYGAHTLGAGAYRFALTPDEPPLIFDLPAGVQLTTVGIVLADADAGPGFIGLILEVPGGGSWICLDLERSEECGRRVGNSGGGGASGASTRSSAASGVGSAFDRISDSLWREDAP